MHAAPRSDRPLSCHRRLLAAATGLELALLVLAPVLQAQQCPATAGNFTLDIDTPQVEGRVVCEPRDRGRHCFLFCPYSGPPGQGLGNFGVRAVWYPQAPIAGQSEDVCRPARDANHFPSPTRMASVSWGTNYSQTVPAHLALGVIRQLAPVVEPLGVPCGGGGGAGPPSSCQQDAERLRQLETAFAYDVSRDHFEAKLLHYRAEQAKWSAIYTDLHTANYNGPYQEEIRAVRTDSDYRRRIADRLTAGEELDWAGDPSAFARSVRMRYEQEIDRVTRVHTNLVRAGMNFRALAEMQQLRQRMQDNGCLPAPRPECDPRGKWRVFSQESALDEIWEFGPNGEGTEQKYGWRAGAYSRAADSEGPVLILYWEDPNLQHPGAGSYEWTFPHEQCQVGRGWLTLAGEPRSLSWITRFIEPARAEVSLAAPVPNAVYQLEFRGQSFEVLYNRGTDRGLPIDLYYYRTPGVDRVPGVNNGEPLYNRFVRVPAIEHPDQSSVRWVHVYWTQRNGSWALQADQGVDVVVGRRVR